MGIVQVSPPPSMTLAKNYYADNATMSEYYDAMSKVLAAVHPSEAARTKAANLSHLVIDFETRMSAVLPELDDLADVNVCKTCRMNRKCEAWS